MGSKNEFVPLVGAGVPGDDVGSTADDHLVHVAPYQHLPMPVGHRCRVVGGPVPHQGQGTDPARPLVAGVVRRGRQGSRSSRSPSSRWPIRSVWPRSWASIRFRQLLFQVGVKCLKALKGRHRHQEVAPHIAHHPLHLSLVVPLARSAEPVLEQVVGLELGEGPRALSPAVFATASLVLSYTMHWDIPSRKAKAETWPSRNASVVSAG